MSLTKFGDWDLVLNLANHMVEDVKRANFIALAQLSSRAESLAVKHMRDQDLKWKKLSKKYLDYKARKNLSTKIMISTSNYFQAITSQVKGDTAFAGVFRKKKEKNGEFIADIARVHEYGSIARGIPPRPLWHVVFKEMKEYLIKEQLFAAEVLRQFKTRTRGKG